MVHRCAGDVAVYSTRPQTLVNSQVLQHWTYPELEFNNLHNIGVMMDIGLVMNWIPVGRPDIGFVMNWIPVRVTYTTGQQKLENLEKMRVIFSSFSSFCWPYRASNNYLAGPIGPADDPLLLL